MDSPPYEQLDVCPACYGVCLAETFCCDGCGEYISGEYVKTARGDRYCEQCYSTRDLFD